MCTLLWVVGRGPLKNFWFFLTTTTTAVLRVLLAERCGPKRGSAQCCWGGQSERRQKVLPEQQKHIVGDCFCSLKMTKSRTWIWLTLGIINLFFILFELSHQIKIIFHNSYAMSQWQSLLLHMEENNLYVNNICHPQWRNKLSWYTMAFQLHDLGQHPASTESTFKRYIGIIREEKEEITVVLLESKTNPSISC